MIIKSNIYDKLKWLTLIALPAFIAFWLTVAPIWDLSHVTQVAQTAAATDVLLGALLQISSNNYNKNPPIDGYMDSDSEDENTGNPDVGITFTKHPKDLLKGDTVLLKVGKPPKQTHVKP